MADFDKSIDKRIKEKFLVIDKKIKDAFSGIKNDIKEIKDNKLQVIDNRKEITHIDSKLEKIEQRINKIKAEKPESKEILNLKNELEKLKLKELIRKATDKEKKENDELKRQLFLKEGLEQQQKDLEKKRKDIDSKYQELYNSLKKKQDKLEEEYEDKIKELSNKSSNDISDIKNIYTENQKLIEVKYQLFQKEIIKRLEAINSDNAAYRESLSELINNNNKQVSKLIKDSESRFRSLIKNLDEKRNQELALITRQLAVKQETIKQADNIKEKRGFWASLFKKEEQEIKPARTKSKALKVSLNQIPDNAPSGFWKVLPYIFLIILFILALNQYFKWDFITGYNIHLSILGIITGGATFWKNRKKIEGSMDEEKRKEELEEQSRKLEFASKYPRINKIPVLRSVVKWMYKEGPSSLAVIAILAILFSLYVYNISTVKFVDTDEARLFYDAKLILDGAAPFKDFDTRAVPLLYFLSGFIYLFGNDINTLYLISTVFVIILLFFSYLLTKIFFKKKIAILTMILLGITPIIINLLYVKTQTFSMPLSLLSSLIFYKYLKDNSKIWILLSALFMIVALLIRESSVIFFCIFVMLIFIKEQPKERIVKQLKVTLWFLAIILIVSLSLIFAFTALQNRGHIDETVKTGETDIQRLSRVPEYYSPIYISGSIFYCLILLLKTRNSLKSEVIFALPLIAFLSFVIVYAYAYLKLGFWPQYLMELAPFYSLATSISLVYIGRSLDNKQKIVFGVLFVFIFISMTIPSYVYLKEYMGVYSKEGVQNLSSYIDSTTNISAVIFGGNPIYSFLSGRQHLLLLSHGYYKDEIREKVILAMKTDPPEIVIIDHYTDRYYYRNPQFYSILNSSYILEKEFESKDYGKKWNAKLYRLNRNYSLSL